jgi:hypothetical protein
VLDLTTLSTAWAGARRSHSPLRATARVSLQPGIAESTPPPYHARLSHSQPVKPLLLEAKCLVAS